MPEVGDRIRTTVHQTLYTHDGVLEVAPGALATISSIGVHGPGTIRAWIDRPRYEVSFRTDEWEPAERDA